MNRRHSLIILVLILATSCGGPPKPLYKSEAFTVLADRVVQGSERAIAADATTLKSSYLYDSALRPRSIQFKFAINGRDNEAPPGEDHILYLSPDDGRVVTPILTFGRPSHPGVEPLLQQPLQGTTQVTFRVDLSEVYDAFNRDGVFQPASGAPILADEFEGVYIAGSEAPLTWDFNAFTDRHRLTDDNADGVYEITLPFESGGSRPFDDEGYAVWSLTSDVSDFPSHRSDQPLIDALYNLSLEELQQDIREDGAFMAGAKWEGVWTRDISYSILLSLAFLDPESSKRSLRAKVDRGRIVQDTGTGGSWPISSDRMTWALAAWEVYLATGDQDWLREAYDLIAASAESDLKTTLDQGTGLFFGESSFLDWREQTYPTWMDPKDIYLSRSLGTNAVFYRTFDILARMADQLGEPSDGYRETRDRVQVGMNRVLWDERLGRYGQYVYGRNYASLSPRAEALGTALSVLFGVPDSSRAETAVAGLPMTTYGVPSIWPQIPGIPPYHNDGIWPFVVAYATWAGAHVGNPAVVEHGLASMYRAAALFLTNKENFVAGTGHFEGTQINSDRQLWSVAGNLASVYRVLLGMRLHEDRLEFRPFVPEAYRGTRVVKGLRYRNAVLDVTVEGFGADIARAELDGEPVERARIDAGLRGAHSLRIVLGGTLPAAQSRISDNLFSPATPVVVWDGARLEWDAVEGADRYGVYANGEIQDWTTDLEWAAQPSPFLSEYQVLAEGGGGLQSFLSEPVRLGGQPFIAEPPAARESDWVGATGRGYATLSLDRNRGLGLVFSVQEAGRYALDVRYSNGSGPVNTDNKAAVRSLYLNSRRVGAVVMPQRGTGRWADWGYSNPITVDLEAGIHRIAFRLSESDRNMNGAINRALVDHVRITRLATD